LDVSCIVLAGGKSTRLGRNKIAEIIGGQSLLERVISILSHLNTEIIIVTAKDSSLPELTQYQDLKFVSDIFPGKGSIGGMYSGLRASKSFYNLVVACDMPFLNLNLIRYMMSITQGYDAVVPRLTGDICEPLHAIYSKNCIPGLENMIKGKVLKIIELFSLVNVKYLEQKEIDLFDPKHISFFNINTEADLELGRSTVIKEETHSDKC
jgi:molybdopterin-guanine dinucleotide biosynthesis protein A